MGLIKGGALRIFQTSLYAINFCCAAIILGIFSYFLSVLADRNLVIAKKWQAVEGLSGVAVLYTIFAVVLTCCLGGISFFAFLAIVLDICMCGAMIAIAILTRNGASSCSGHVNTPLGSGQANSKSGFGGQVTYAVSLRTACRYETACFAVAIIGAIFFLITAAMQIVLVRHHKKEKRYGPSPKNNYTSGYGKGGLFSRKNKGNKGVEAGTLATPAQPVHDVRPSHDTGYTGSTMAAPHNTTAVHDKVEPTGYGNSYTNSAYHTQPTGTAVNPYGYDNRPTNYTTGTATNY